MRGDGRWLFYLIMVLCTSSVGGVFMCLGRVLFLDFVVVISFGMAQSRYGTSLIPKYVYDLYCDMTCSCWLL